MIKGHMTRRKTDWLVSAKEKLPDGSTYDGPAARVSYDKSWLHIVTDDHEGNAMLNIEALPALRRALAQVAKELRAKKPEGLNEVGEPARSEA